MNNALLPNWLPSTELCLARERQVQAIARSASARINRPNEISEIGNIAHDISLCGPRLGDRKKVRSDTFAEEVRIGMERDPLSLVCRVQAVA